MRKHRWSQEGANHWYQEKPWLVGCNFTPSTAINQLEMWQEDSFDPLTIDRELGWAAALGFNTVRIFLHDLLWAQDPARLIATMRCYLDLAAGRGISTTFVLFDDCWNDTFQLGRQPEPVPGVHNSGWVRSPGSRVVLDPELWSPLEDYVKGILTTFAEDERVLMWDLYNEPGNSGLGERSLPLLTQVFQWANQARPTQPLTAGLWCDNKALNSFQLRASDVITFHNYDGYLDLVKQINSLKIYGYPLVCTEYMARKQGSRFQSHLPVFKQMNVGCYNWGLVLGKTQTCFPWGSEQGCPEPELWFHDIFRQDGTPFDPAEVAFIQSITGKALGSHPGESTPAWNQGQLES